MTSERPGSLRFVLLLLIWVCGGMAHPSSAWAQGNMPGMPGMAAQPPQAPPSGSGKPGPTTAPTMKTTTAAGATVEADPIRCWWRTSTTGVRTGETFSLVLTCAVIENEAVQIVPDESRLGPSVIQMAPFEIVGGTHPADLRTPDRRFFQYEYTLRMINPDFIGKDVRIPDVTMHYRVNSKVAANASLQGRDLIYALSPLTLRILAMVPADAIDIRDTPNDTFATIETLTFRASMLRIVAITLLALGLLLAVLSLVRVFTRTTRSTKTADLGISTGAVLGLAARELGAVQEESQQGWSAPLIERALAASRVVAACALGREPSQRIARGDTTAGEGRLVRPLRRGRSTVVWSSVTADDLVERPAASSKAVPAERRQTLDELRGALTALTVAQYAQTAAPDRASLDAALARVADAARTLKGEHAWPRPLLRRWSGRTAEPELGT